MNKRQKKKQYKKIYGHNPLVKTEERYTVHLTDAENLNQEKESQVTREDPVVTASRALTERRSKCRRSRWGA